MSAAHLFNALFNAGLTVFLLTLVTNFGMTFSVKQILAPVFHHRAGLILRGRYPEHRDGWKAGLAGDVTGQQRVRYRLRPASR